MERAEVERVVTECLPGPLPPKDLDDLVRRVAALEEELAVLRTLPLDETEPFPAPPEEWA